MISIETKILKGSKIQLEILNESHKNELYIAAQDERIWTAVGSKAFGEKFHIWFDKALSGLQKKSDLPFVVRRLSDNKIIGSTRYYDISPEHHRLTVGYTWYIPEVWGSYANPETKFLLFQFAFENLNMNRVQFCTDIRNSHSCAAIRKLGAIEEGVLRQHMVLPDGYIRDTIIFSIIKSQWPQVKKNLEKRLGC